MKTKLLFLVLFGITTAAYACPDTGCCTNSPCDCVDPACGAPFSCMGYGECCAAFGNIGAIDDEAARKVPLVYHYATVEKFAPAHRSYKGEGYHFKEGYRFKNE